MESEMVNSEVAVWGSELHDQDFEHALETFPTLCIIIKSEIL